MRGLNLKEIMSKSNMNQQGLNIATYGQAYDRVFSVVYESSLANCLASLFSVQYVIFDCFQEFPTEPLDKIRALHVEFELAGKSK